MCSLKYLVLLQNATLSEAPYLKKKNGLCVYSCVYVDLDESICYINKCKIYFTFIHLVNLMHTYGAAFINVLSVIHVYMQLEIIRKIKTHF